ncbi:hypothetical protein [Luteolibacter sp. LG18]|uniref:sodium:solute symporter family transporter n=1 Tax=Luteolibacter sp. LG18 TaxID=2819286 RepID=UPI0030C6E9E5
MTRLSLFQKSKALPALLALLAMAPRAFAADAPVSSGGISTYDYFIIAVYLVFIVITGLVFRRMSKNTSDYFRAGGSMPWWITGTSSWIASFSAWTFTGAAGMIYETGTLVLVLYYSAAIALALVLWKTCVLFRRMRVVTWMEAVRLRFGKGSEQFYTWVKVPLLLFLSGISLNAIGVFMSSVFHVDMNLTLVVLGVIVTIVAFAGGAWAILASDFVQMFLVVTITVTAAALTLNLPEIGGLSNLLQKVEVPISPSNWGSIAQPFTIIMWVIAISWMQFSTMNNMENSVMYLMTKSDRDARRMVLIPLIGSILGPLIWVIPPLAATLLHPNLAAEFPALKHPNEASFVAMCMHVMPKGLLGLLICAMLGATLTSMDAGLNKGVGVFIRSFYLPVLNPQCPEKKLLVLSKVCTLVFGVLIIGFALLVNAFRSGDLFTFVNQVAGSLTIPLALPLALGLFFRRTPAWSAWSTGLVGFIVSLVVNFGLSQHLDKFFGPLTPREHGHVLLGVTTASTAILGTIWFFFTALFYERQPQEDKDRAEEFFQRLRTPVDVHGAKEVHEHLYRLLGLLCLVYGLFIVGLFFIPNSFSGRLSFVFCGGVIFLVGLILWLISRRKVVELREEAAIEQQPGHS